MFFINYTYGGSYDQKLEDRITGVIITFKLQEYPQSKECVSLRQLCKIIDKYQKFRICYSDLSSDDIIEHLVNVTIKQGVSQFLLLLREYKLYIQNRNVFEWWYSLSDYERKALYNHRWKGWWAALPSEIIKFYKSY